jgi:hypothetical protein
MTTQTARRNLKWAAVGALATSAQSMYRVMFLSWSSSEAVVGNTAEVAGAATLGGVLGWLLAAFIFRHKPAQK